MKWLAFGSGGGRGCRKGRVLETEFVVFYILDLSFNRSMKVCISGSPLEYQRLTIPRTELTFLLNAVYNCLL
jgi:hypothetical protein